jgi:transmembrane sensor
MDQEQAAELARKFAAGGHTDAEHSEFWVWLASLPMGECQSQMEKYSAIFEAAPPADAPPLIWAKIRAQLDMARSNEPQPGEAGREPIFMPARGSLLRRYRLPAAAAAILLLLISTWLLEQRRPGNPDNHVPDAAPGGNHAILTLSNGQKIILDSAKNGALAIQNNTQVNKLNSGELEYTAGQGRPSPEIYNVLTTPRGGQYQLKLPDGSKVWLNAASSIRYPTAFTGHDRHVTITGEAYLEIAPDPAKPFSVSLDGAGIAVLGTEFNINAYPDEAASRTTLIRGAIKINNLILRPGEQAESRPGSPIKIIGDADTDEVLAWKNGLFHFDRADIRTVMRQLARWYDVDVSYDGPPPPGKFTGEIGRGLTLTQVLHGLAQTRVHFKIEGGKKLTIMP